jgi:hypothetical protein
MVGIELREDDASTEESSGVQLGKKRRVVASAARGTEETMSGEALP